MTKAIQLSLFTLYLFFLFPVHFIYAAMPADPNANETTRKVLNYINGIGQGTVNRVITGQQLDQFCNVYKEYGDADSCDPSNYKTGDFRNIEAIYQKTGERPGLVSTDYYTLSDPDHAKYLYRNPYLIQHWNHGGLVSLCLHMINPITGNNSKDRTQLASLASLYTPGNSAYENFRTELRLVAEGLQELEDKGVTVLFRPFHEMNGGWFWWGDRNADEFKALWWYTFDYVTNTKGLHNILWVYSPSENSLTRSFTKYYPGDNYADLVSLDWYADKYDLTIDGYSEMVELDKPLILGEFGFSGHDPAADASGLITAIKNKYPQIRGFIWWGQAHNLAQFKNVKKLMNDPWSLNLGEIDFGKLLEEDSTISSLAAPTNLRVVGCPSSKPE